MLTAICGQGFVDVDNAVALVLSSFAGIRPELFTRAAVGLSQTKPGRDGNDARDTRAIKAFGSFGLGGEVALPITVPILYPGGPLDWIVQVAAACSPGPMRAGALYLPAVCGFSVK